MKWAKHLFSCYYLRSLKKKICEMFSNFVAFLTIFELYSFETFFGKKILATYRNKLERNMLGNSFFTFLPLTFVISILFLPSVLLLLLDLFWKMFFLQFTSINYVCAIVFNSPDWIHFLCFSLQPNFCKFKDSKTRIL